MCKRLALLWAGARSHGGTVSSGQRVTLVPQQRQRPGCGSAALGQCRFRCRSSAVFGRPPARRDVARAAAQPYYGGASSHRLAWPPPNVHGVVAVTKAPRSSPRSHRALAIAISFPDRDPPPGTRHLSVVVDECVGHGLELLVQLLHLLAGGAAELPSRIGVTGHGREQRVPRLQGVGDRLLGVLKVILCGSRPRTTTSRREGGCRWETTRATQHSRVTTLPRQYQCQEVKLRRRPCT